MRYLCLSLVITGEIKTVHPTVIVYVDRGNNTGSITQKKPGLIPAPLVDA